MFTSLLLCCSFGGYIKKQKELHNVHGLGAMMHNNSCQHYSHDGNQQTQTGIIVFLIVCISGFCKNDKNHDVRLKIEALRVTDSQVKNGTKVGEAFFAIYPRTNTPRINLYARKDEELYHYSNIMALLRVQNDYLAMHCGRLAYTVSFHEARPPPDGPNTTSRMPSIQEEGKGGRQTPRAPSPAPSTLSVPPLIPEPPPSEPTAQVLQEGRL